MDETERWRFDVGRERLCIAHLKDEALKTWHTEQASSGKCDRCDSAEQDVVNIDDLFEYMLKCIEIEYDSYSASPNVPMSDDLRPAECGSEDLLQKLNDPVDESLAEHFAKVFNEDWVHKGVWTGDESQRRNEAWVSFVDAVKQQRRFTFLDADVERSSDGPWVRTSKVLSDIRTVITECDCITVLPVDQEVVRGRKHRPGEDLSTAEQLGPPPSHLAGSQRMSPPGISFFYSALDDETALAELRGVDGEMATIVTWRLPDSTAVVDLVALGDVPSLFDEKRARLRGAFGFLQRFAEEVSSPVRAHDNPAVDYVPTQIIAEHIRHSITTPNGDPFQGIKYRSAIHPTGTNVVFFADNDDCASGQGLLRMQGPRRTFEATKSDITWT